jgi:hypothetical protein
MVRYVEKPRSDSRVKARPVLAIYSILLVSGPFLLSYAYLAGNDISFSFHRLWVRAGAEAVFFFLILALACPAFAFYRIRQAASRHQEYASWPSRATVSKRCGYLIAVAYFAAATLAANGSPSWTNTAQIQLFVILYVLGIASAAAFGVGIADRIGRELMASRFGKKVGKRPAVSIFSDHDNGVYVTFADGRIERIFETEIRDKREMSTSFETIVNASRQPSKHRILLLSEFGDVFASTTE